MDFFLLSIALSLCFSKHLYLSFSLPMHLNVLCTFYCCKYATCFSDVVYETFYQPAFQRIDIFTNDTVTHIMSTSFVHSGLTTHGPLGATISKSQPCIILAHRISKKSISRKSPSIYQSLLSCTVTPVDQSTWH